MKADATGLVVGWSLPLSFWRELVAGVLWRLRESM